MKPRNLNQNLLSMVVVGTLSPVEMRLWKKWKRRWAAEPGVWAVLFILFPPPLCSGMVLCLVDVLVLLPAVLHKVFQIR